MAIFSTSQNKKPFTHLFKNLYNWKRWRDHQVGQSLYWSSEGIAAPHMGEVVDWGSFPVFYSASAQPTPSFESLILHINRRGSGQGCTFGGLIDTSIPMGELSPKTLHFGDSNGDFKLKRLRAYLGTEETEDIMTIDSSKCASWQDTQCAIVKTEELSHCRGQTHKSLFQRQIYSQSSKHCRKCRIIS
jgi:hypothetical protein